MHPGAVVVLVRRRYLSGPGAHLRQGNPQRQSAGGDAVSFRVLHRHRARFTALQPSIEGTGARHLRPAGRARHEPLLH